MDGATLTVPPGALSTPQELRLIRTDEEVPVGYTGYSPVYRVEPQDPVVTGRLTLSLAMTAAGPHAAVFRFDTVPESVDRLGGAIAGALVTASTTRLGGFFVADGVDFDETPDLSCLVTRMNDAEADRTSAVRLFVGVQDCDGRPARALSGADFRVIEDSTPVDAAAGLTSLPLEEQVFASLVLDLTDSRTEALTPLIEGARAFVERLLVDEQVQAQISISIFDGADISRWQAPTLDATTLLSRLDALYTYAGQPAPSRDVHGALVLGLITLDLEADDFVSRNGGTALTSRHMVLFTAGPDTGGLFEHDDVTLEWSGSPDTLWLVALGPESDELASLAPFARRGLHIAPDRTHLTRELSAVAARIAAQQESQYLLGYCSTQTSGSHRATVEVSSGTMFESGYSIFDATGHTASCTPETLVSSCDGVGCGRFGCGFCDDRTSFCETANRQCVSFCDLPEHVDVCGDRTFENPNGYIQSCPDVPGVREECFGICWEAAFFQQSPFACGGCGNACQLAGDSCFEGECVCPEAQTACADACASLSFDDDHCGACGTPCAAGTVCLENACVSPPETLLWAERIRANQPVRSPARVDAATDGGFVLLLPTGGLTLDEGEPTAASFPVDTANVVARFDDSGQLLWSTAVAGEMVDVATTPSGGAVVVGSFTGSATFGETVLTASSTRAGVIAHLDSTGAFDWAQSLSSSPSFATSGVTSYRIERLGDGRLVMAGSGDQSIRVSNCAECELPGAAGARPFLLFFDEAWTTRIAADTGFTGLEVLSVRPIDGTEDLWLLMSNGPPQTMLMHVYRDPIHGYQFQPTYEDHATMDVAVRPTNELISLRSAGVGYRIFDNDFVVLDSFDAGLELAFHGDDGFPLSYRAVGLTGAYLLPGDTAEGLALRGDGSVVVYGQVMRGFSGGSMAVLPGRDIEGLELQLSLLQQYESLVPFGDTEHTRWVDIHGGSADVFVAAFTAEGRLRWATAARGPGDDRAYDMALLPDGSLVVIGELEQTLTFEGSTPVTLTADGPWDLFIARLNP